MLNRQATAITKYWKCTQDEITITGAEPNTSVLDNDASHDLQDSMYKCNIPCQFSPPYLRRSNIAERLTQAFKCHFKIALATFGPDFPLVKWHMLLEQALLTLNILHSYRINPALYACAFFYGKIDFNKTL